MKELNLFFDEQFEIRMNYNNRQITDYDEFVAIEHVVDRHKNDFSSNIDIYKLFNEVKDKLVEEYRKRSLIVNDIYDIPYENIGDNCHVLRVVTLPNSKDILTMFPLTDNNLGLEEELYDDGVKKLIKRNQ